jgi:hypothetical protein
MPDSAFALLIGIDKYDRLRPLTGCVADAREMGRLLRRHADLTPNYQCEIYGDEMAPGRPITRAELRTILERTFTKVRGSLLFYFAGHGAVTRSGGMLCTTDAAFGDVGISMDEILTYANTSPATSIHILLDCCHAGAMANPALVNGRHPNGQLAILRENLTILAASRDDETSQESGGRGVFTNAVCEALEGGAADLLGAVTAPAIYTFVERRFGALEQRPIYKSHTSEVETLRRCEPAIDRFNLRRLADLFPESKYVYQLDPQFEREDADGRPWPVIDERKVEIGVVIKRFRDAGLVQTSVPGEQLFWTAQKSHSVELTPRGREYWQLVKSERV